MNTTPQQVANYFLDKAADDGINVSPMKLVKLIYIAYGWYIALTDERLFDEGIQAWEHGPVIPSIYHEFKKFGSNPINCRSRDLNMGSIKNPVPSVPRINEGSKVVILILSKVWAAYRGFTGWDLSEKTHEDGSPWHKIYKPEQKHLTLKDDDIKEHFTMKISTYLGHDKSE